MPLSLDQVTYRYDAFNLRPEDSDGSGDN